MRSAVTSPWTALTSRPTRRATSADRQGALAGHRPQNLPTLPGQGVPKQIDRVERNVRALLLAAERGGGAARNLLPRGDRKGHGVIPVSIDRRLARDRRTLLVRQVIVRPSPLCAAAPLWPRWSGPPPPSRAISPGRRREPTRSRSRRECRKHPRREPGHRGRRPALASAD